MHKLKRPPFVNIFKLMASKPKDSADMFEKIMLQNKPIVRFLNPVRMYLINHPDAAQRIIQQPEDIYIKKNMFVKRLSIAFGDGLVTSEGELWQSQRELLKPYFFPKYLEQYANLAIEKTTHLMNNQWKGYAKTAENFNLTDAMMRLILKISAQALFNHDFGKETEKVLECVELGQKYILSYYLIPPSWPSITRWKYNRLNQHFQHILQEMVNARRAHKNKPDDILTALVTAKDPMTQELLSMDLICSQIVTLLVTGHETTGALMGWLWYELGKNPSVYHKLVAEIDSELQGQTPTFKDLSKLKYLRSVIDEALRMYPVIWMLPRKSVKDHNLMGYKIPKNSIVLVSPYTMQRNPALWSQPHAFNPERFSKTAVCPRHKMSYMPFGGGHRICIGKNFAIQQSMLILSIILQNYDVKILNRKKPRNLPLVSLKQMRPVIAKIKTRTTHQ